MTIATAAALAVLLWLGTWQVQRLQWKTGLIESIETGLAEPPAILSDAIEPVVFRRYLGDLSFRTESPWLLGASAQGGRLGGRLLIVGEDSLARHWLIELGWVSDDDFGRWRRDGLSINGLAKAEIVTRNPVSANWATPSSQDDGRIYAEDLAALGESAGFVLQPLVLVLRTGLDQLPVVPGAARPDLRNNHLGYAITWYGLAAALIGVYIAFGRARGRGER